MNKLFYLGSFVSSLWSIFNQQVKTPVLGMEKQHFENFLTQRVESYKNIVLAS